MRHLTFLRRFGIPLIGIWCGCPAAPALAANSAQDAAFCPTKEIAESHSWAPDSSRVVFATEDEGVKIYSVRFAVANPITSEPFFGLPVWAPDDGRIAILHAEGAAKDGPPFATLYLWDSHNPFAPIPLASGLSSTMRPAWSPNGNRILVADIDGSLVTVDPRTGKKGAVFTRKSDSSPRVTGNPAWINATEVIYQLKEGELFIKNVENDSLRTMRGPGDYIAFSALPNGDIWTSRREDDRYRITLLSGATLGRTLDVPVSRFSGPSAQGMIAARFLPQGGIKMVDSKTGVVTSLTGNAGDTGAALSPDGQMVAFSRRDAGEISGHLCVMAIR